MKPFAYRARSASWSNLTPLSCICLCTWMLGCSTTTQSDSGDLSLSQRGPATTEFCAQPFISDIVVQAENGALTADTFVDTLTNSIQNQAQRPGVDSLTPFFHASEHRSGFVLRAAHAFASMSEKQRYSKFNALNRKQQETYLEALNSAITCLEKTLPDKYLQVFNNRLIERALCKLGKRPKTDSYHKLISEMTKIALTLRRHRGEVFRHTLLYPKDKQALVSDFMLGIDPTNAAANFRGVTAFVEKLRVLSHARDHNDHVIGQAIERQRDIWNGMLTAPQRRVMPHPLMADISKLEMHFLKVETLSDEAFNDLMDSIAFNLIRTRLFSVGMYAREYTDYHFQAEEFFHKYISTRKTAPEVSNFTKAILAKFRKFEQGLTQAQSMLEHAHQFQALKYTVNQLIETLE